MYAGAAGTGRPRGGRPDAGAGRQERLLRSRRRGGGGARAHGREGTAEPPREGDRRAAAYPRGSRCACREPAHRGGPGQEAAQGCAGGGHGFTGPRRHRAAHGGRHAVPGRGPAPGHALRGVHLPGRRGGLPLVDPDGELHALPADARHPGARQGACAEARVPVPLVSRRARRPRIQCAAEV